MKNSVYAIIPAYEPDEVLLELIDEIKIKIDCEIIVVDDGSSPECGGLFGQAAEKCILLRHETNSGKGAALKTAFEYLIKNVGTDSDYTVVLVDADGQHKPDDAAQLVSFREKNRDALCIGSRAFSGKIPLRSRFGNTVTRFIFRMASGVYLNDTQSGLRAFGSGLLKDMVSVDGERYEYEMNMLLSFAKKKIPLAEMPIETIYVDGNSSSHFDPIVDSAKIYIEIIKFSGASFASFLIDYILYAVFVHALVKLPQQAAVSVSNIAARVISAAFNFTVNKKLVFKSKDKAWRAGAKYALLAAAILTADTRLLRFMVEDLKINKYAAKLIVEPIMFIFSWIVQRFFVFSNKDKTGRKT